MFGFTGLGLEGFKGLGCGIWGLRVLGLEV